MGCANSKPLSPEEMTLGLRSLLEISARKSCAKVGAKNGIWNVANTRVPLPKGNIGMLLGVVKKLPLIGGKVDEFHKELNRTAELAVKASTDQIIAVAQALTFDTPQAVIRGPKAATDFWAAHSAAVVALLQEQIKAKMAETKGMELLRSIQELASDAADQAEELKAQASSSGVEVEGAPEVPRMQDEEDALYAHVAKHASLALFAKMGEYEVKVRKEPYMYKHVRDLKAKEALSWCFGPDKRPLP